MSAPETSARHQFTAAQYAAALGVSKRAMLYKLESVPFSMNSSGARVWLFTGLPSELQIQLHEQARARGFRDVASLLSAPVEDEKARLAFADACAADQRRAVDLHRALAPSLARRHDLTLTEADFNRRGVEDYARVFGHAVSEQHFRRLFERTVRRAGSAEQFDCLDHYLDEDARPIAGNATEGGPFAALHSLITGFRDPAQPSAEECRALWDAAFVIVDDGQAVKADAIAFLAQHATFLAKNAEALQRNFNRLFNRWKEDGEKLAALDDQRAGRKRGPELSDDEFKLLVAYAAKYGGGCDQAWREALRLGKLSQEIVAYYINQRRRMPAKYREQIIHSARDVAKRLHGPRHAKLAGPYINRNPDHAANPLLAGQWDQSDDLTLPCVWWEQKEDGSIWVGQGQFLAWVDERSWMVFNFVLIPEKGYNAFHIRNSWTRKCDTYGLPVEGLYLEGSFWQSARVWVGRRDEVTWGETEQGIRRLGVRIKQAMLPRGKIIERIFGNLQDYFQTEPGYVGRNPLTDRYEEVQKQIRLVRSGHAHPSEFFYSKTDWTARLAEWCHQYNHEPKYGKYHDGLSPAQVYEKLCPVERIVHIPDECRHLLASNKIEATIGRNGLSFQFGTRRFNYKNEALAGMKLRDPRVIAWFNPEDPALCGVTDRNGENPIVSRLATDVPNHDAPAELLSLAHAENAAFERPGKELYRTLKPVFSAEFEKRRVRPVLADGVAVETARVFRQETEKMKEEEKQQNRLETRARKIGLKVQRNDPRYAQRVEAATDLTAWMARHEENETP